MSVREVIKFISFSASSLISYFVDYGVFILCTKIVWKDLSVSMATLAATITARIISSLCNYFLHRQVFKTPQKTYHHTFGKFVITASFLMFLSWFLINTMYKVSNLNTTILKPIVDAFIFILNYLSQKFWVFHPKKQSTAEVTEEAEAEPKAEC